MTPTIVRVDPLRSPETAVLTGILAKRVRDFNEATNPYQTPEEAVKTVMSGLWNNNDGVLALMFIDAESNVVGHMVAMDSSRDWVIIFQAKADGNVGDAIKQSEAMVAEWAKARGRKGLWIITHRNPETWAKKYGYQVTHTIMNRSI